MGNNIDVDPLFMDAPHGDLRLLIHSPAIDTGDDAACPVTDMFGILRPQGAHCDMGAFEFVIPPNHSPFITGITAPFAPVQVGQSINATVEFSDPDVGDTHTLALSWGDGSTTTASATVPSMSTSHTYTSPGVYTVTATITDAAGAFDTETFQYVVVYDPNGGFVTGGGWINSPEGAYTADPSLTGKATFGFVAKYQKGANVPTGQTEFQFHVANLNFKSTSFDWLVIAGSKAQFKGTGTINGAGEYGFMLTAIDGSPDKFRIKIWDKATGQVIYDNMLGAADDAIPSTVIEGGSMVIHKPK
jgi:PKD repeat protein